MVEQYENVSVEYTFQLDYKNHNIFLMYKMIVLTANRTGEN